MKKFIGWFLIIIICSCKKSDSSPSSLFQGNIGTRSFTTSNCFSQLMYINEVLYLDIVGHLKDSTQVKVTIYGFSKKAGLYTFQDTGRYNIADCSIMPPGTNFIDYTAAKGSINLNTYDGKIVAGSYNFILKNGYYKIPDSTKFSGTFSMPLSNPLSF